MKYIKPINIYANFFHNSLKKQISPNYLGDFHPNKWDSD
uniref:Uncharacterized protein n=1 Tax=Podoviridae sp. cttxo15 TaxID=2826584 RepID=A0A8S5N1K8_9CAUD|nr:MAG TPA: hypothetical protein [Podoviridae sp. cttxo15]